MSALITSLILTTPEISILITHSVPVILAVVIFAKSRPILHIQTEWKSCTILHIQTEWKSCMITTIMVIGNVTLLEI